MSTFQAVLKEFAAAFVSDKRDDGATFYKLRDDAPEWLRGDAGREIMFAIHKVIDDRLPDDWIYEAAYFTASNLDGYTCDDADGYRDAVHEVADGLVDVYNADRLKWLASHLGNAALVDEACKEFGTPEQDTCERIGLGQYMAYDRIANAVIDAVEAEAESRDEAAEESAAESEA